LVAEQHKYQIIEHNEPGKAPASRLAPRFKKPATPTPANQPPQNCEQIPFAVGPLDELANVELSPGGKHYVKIGGKVEALKSDMPTEQVQQYVTTNEKTFFLPFGFPHQFLLSPESLGGPSSRGVKEMLCRTVQGWQLMLMKYAALALRFSIANGMSLGNENGGISGNTTDW